MNFFKSPNKEQESIGTKKNKRLEPLKDLDI